MESNPFEFLRSMRDIYSEKELKVDLQEIDHHYKMICHFNDQFHESRDSSFDDECMDDLRECLFHLCDYIRLNLQIFQAE